jgi:hypothetical protein
VGYVSVSAFQPNWVKIVIFTLLAASFFGAKKLLSKKLSSISLILLAAALGIGVSFLANLI